MAPRPATDPKRWSAVSGGRNIRRQPKKSNLQKAMGALPILHAATAPDVAGGSYVGPDGFLQRRGDLSRAVVAARVRSG